MKTASLFLKKKLDKNIDHFLDNSQIHYFKKVLKMGLNDSVFIYDGNGTRWSGLFNGKDAVSLIDNETKKRKNFITAIVPILKKARFEFLVQKLTELGVGAIHAYVSDKSKHLYSHSKELSKIDRYLEIINSAAHQSENFFPPALHIVNNIKEIDFSKFESVCALELGSDTPFSSDSKCAVFITGGEFGFSDDEKEFLQDAKVNYYNLGENILRAETAPIVALSRISF